MPRGNAASHGYLVHLDPDTAELKTQYITNIPAHKLDTADDAYKIISDGGITYIQAGKLTRLKELLKGGTL